MALDNLSWWLIIILNFTSYFIFRFGMISRGRKRQHIQFLGGSLLTLSFILMFFLFGFKQFLLLIPIFWFIVTPINEVVIKRIYKKLFAKIDEAVKRMISPEAEEMFKEAEEMLNKVGGNNNAGLNKFIEKFLAENNVKKEISRDDVIDLIKNNKNETKQKQPNLFEGFGPVNLAITDFFFDEKMVKINTFVSKEGVDREFPVCHQMNKEELSDFIMEAEDWKKVLEINKAFQLDLFTKTGKVIRAEGSLFDRLMRGETDDVVSLRLQPLIIKNIYLDLKIEIVGGDIEDPTKGTVNSTIFNYYKKP